MHRLLLGGVAVFAMLAPMASVSADEPGRGRALILVDGDFYASSYVDGLIPAVDDRRHLDLLRLISPDGRTLGELQVTNGVTGPPESLAIAPNGRTAFVVEHLGPRSSAATTRAELQPGTTLTAVDLTDGRLAVHARATVAAGPEAIAISPDGSRLAVVGGGDRTPVLQLLSFTNGRFGPPRTVPLASLGIEARGDASALASSVEWSSDGRTLALNIHKQGLVLFVSVAGEEVRPVGSPVPVGPDNFSGRFTPDGRHYVSNQWGRDFSAETLEGRLPRRAGDLAVVRFDPGGSHSVISRAASDWSPEGVAISRDGRFVASANMRNTALPTTSRHYTREASVSLFALDPASGALTKIGDTPFEGVLPEGLSFDAAGERIYVANYELRGDPHRGSIEVFRLTPGQGTGLVHERRLPAPAGAHIVEMIP